MLPPVSVMEDFMNDGNESSEMWLITNFRKGHTASVDELSRGKYLSLFIRMVSYSSWSRYISI